MKPFDDSGRCESADLRPCDFSLSAPGGTRLLDSRLNGPPPVGLPWPSLLSFVRLVSNPRIFEQPLPISDAWHQIEEWLACSVVWIPQPTERHREILGSLLTDTLMRSNLVPDAHLSTLAIEHGLILCSTDRDFARFLNLRWEDPLRQQSA